MDVPETMNAQTGGYFPQIQFCENCAKNRVPFGQTMNFRGPETGPEATLATYREIMDKFAP